MKYLKTPDEVIDITELKRIQSRKELRSIYSQSLKLISEIDRVLAKYWSRHLWRLKGEDEIRILTLNIWSERYKVTVEYILLNLIPIWNKVFKKLGRQKMTLGCTVSTLTGYKSERILQDCIKRDFPNKENIEEWKRHLKNQLYGNQEVLESPVSRKKRLSKLSPLSYRNPKEFMKIYQEEISKRRKQNLKHQQITTKRSFRDCNLWN